MQLNQILIFIKSKNESVTLLEGLIFEYATQAVDSITCLAYPCCTKHSYGVRVRSDGIHAGSIYTTRQARTQLCSAKNGCRLLSTSTSEV